MLAKTEGTLVLQKAIFFGFNGFVFGHTVRKNPYYSKCYICPPSPSRGRGCGSNHVLPYLKLLKSHRDSPSGAFVFARFHHTAVGVALRLE